MSFLRTHRLHWGSHHGLTGNLHEHLDLLMHQEPDKQTREANADSVASAEVPTEMPSQIINPPSGSHELGT